MAVMDSSLQTQAPRAPRADRPPSASASYHSAPNTPSHPPRSSKAKKYPGLRMVTPPSLDAASNPPSSTSLRYAHHTITPKGSHSSQRKGSMGSIVSERPPTPVSRTSAIDSHSSAAAPGTQSTLLQEKLQRERRSEIQRSLTRLAGEAKESGAPFGTPTRCATADGRSHEETPQTADGQNKGFALKEVDQTMSTLHKQNFDLKLELFHRRQRQTDLEQKIEVLEADRTTAEQTNGTLVQELEKRDKAVEEAVHMIVSLEARIELLLREREMTRQVEANNSLLSHLTHSPSTGLPTKGPDPRPQYDVTSTDKHALDRMPSFVSERTENTENLRNVYLDPKSSYFSLAKTNPRAGNSGFVSPSMSLLSESSFLSIYGHKVSKETATPPALPSTIQSRLADGGQRSVSLPSRDYTPSRPQGVDRPGSWDRSKNPGLQPQDSHSSQPLGMTSPLRHALRQTTPLDTGIERSTTARPNRPQVFPKARKENERPVRKVVTDDPGASHHGLPPTPDTMTSSLANRAQVSDDALRIEQGIADSRYPVFTRLTLDQTDEVEPGHWRFKSPEVAQPPSITAFTGRQETPGAAYYENRFPALRRPRSADETTISRHKNDWDSCSDVDDLCSEASSFDYWMREGLQPSRGGKTMAHNKSHLGSNREMPDLFSFPSDTKSWQSNGLFGSLGGTGSLGVDSPLSPALDALGASLPSPEAGFFGKGLAEADSSRSQGVTAAAPPTPYRRSSLKAYTSTPGAPAITRAPQSQDNPNDSEAVRKRSISGHLPGNSKAWPMSDNRSRSPAPPSRPSMQHPDTSAPKRHYPPHASQSQTTTRPRSRGFTSLFRRSLGSTTPQPSASVPPSTAQSPFPPPATSQAAAPETVGFPAWEHRNDPGTGDASATPPPILRKRGPAVVEDATHGGVTRDDKVGSSSRPARATAFSATKSGLGSGLDDVMSLQAGQEGGGAPLTLLADHAGDPETEAAQPSHGHTRRWFNLGRAMNHKTVGT